MIPTLAGAFGSTPLFNNATGGTITTFSSSGKNYKRHTFTGAGSKTFTVLNNPKPFTVLVLGAGGGGSAGYIATIGVGGSAGGGGGAFEGAVTLALGANTGTVGAGGTGGLYATPRGGNRGGSTTFASKTGGGGGGGSTEYDSGQTPGTGDAPTGTGGTGGIVTQFSGNTPATFPGQTLRDSYSLGTVANSGTGGDQSGGSGGTGQAGALVITYEVA